MGCSMGMGGSRRTFCSCFQVPSSCGLVIFLAHNCRPGVKGVKPTVERGVALGVEAVIVTCINNLYIFMHQILGKVRRQCSNWEAF